jgi:hypothetical protein
MSIGREQEHISLALAAVVSVVVAGSLPKRPCNERLQTSLYDLLVFRILAVLLVQLFFVRFTGPIDIATLPESSGESSS